MRKTFVFTSVLFLSVLGTACATRYDARTTTIAPPRSLAVADTTDADIEAAWWRRFEDPSLDAFVEQALSANRDLQAAAARYTAALEMSGAAALLQTPHG